MKILLVQPPLEDFYTTSIRLYPLGLLYAAAVLRETGHEVEILDCLSPLRKHQLALPLEFSYLASYLGNPLFFKAYYRFGLSEEEILAGVQAASPDLIGISSQFTAYFSSVEKLANLLKDHFDIPVFIGGHHATAFTETIRRKAPSIDFVLEGPAEECLPPFLASQGFPCPPGDIDWRAVQPAHDLLPAGEYKMGRKHCMSLTASRGCPYHCDFCSIQAMFGQAIQYRSIEHILEEMRWNYQAKHVRIFNFEDDNLSVDRPWFRDFLQAVADDPVLRGIELTAMNGLCYNTLDADVLSAMARAGFRQLNISLVDQEVTLRQTYHRPGGKAGIEPLVAEAHKLGLFVTVYLIIGLPDQTYEQIQQGVDYLLGLGVLVGPSVFYIPPSSSLFEQLDIPPEIRDNWIYYRSSAFALETDKLSREQLIGIFMETRRKNLVMKKQAFF